MSIAVVCNRAMYYPANTLRAAGDRVVMTDADAVSYVGQGLVRYVDTPDNPDHRQPLDGTQGMQTWLDEQAARALSTAPVDTRAHMQALIWLPMYENIAAGGHVVTDVSSQLSGTVTSGTRRFGAWPGLMFDNATRLPLKRGAAAGFTTAARLCGDWSSLQVGVDQITIWAVLSHPSPMVNPKRCLLSWGATQDAKGGWAIGYDGAAARWYTQICPKGVTNVNAGKVNIRTDKVDASGVSSPSYVNTLTAVAFEVMAHATGYVLVNVFARPITADYESALSLQGFNSLPLVPAGSGGSAAANWDVNVPFTVGARCTTDANSFADNLGPDVSLVQLGMARGQWDQSAGARVVDDLVRNMRAFPQSLIAAGSPRSAGA